MQHFISSYGYAAILLLMLAESACIPVPSELTMPFGGAIAAGAVAGVHLNLALVIVAGVAGNVLGSYLAWAAGRYGGEAATRRWSRFLGGRSGIERSQRWFEPLRRPGRLHRAPAARGADVHLAARGLRAHAAGSLRRLHHGRLHSLDRRPGLGGVRGRGQLAARAAPGERARVRHRRADRPAGDRRDCRDHRRRRRKRPPEPEPGPADTRVPASSSKQRRTD